MTACQLLSHVFLNFFGLWFWFLRYFGALSNHTNSFIDFMSQQVWRLLGGRTWTYLSFSVPQSLFFFLFCVASFKKHWMTVVYAFICTLFPLSFFVCRVWAGICEMNISFMLLVESRCERMASSLWRWTHWWLKKWTWGGDQF